jgi:hypothetical protein
MVWRVVFGCLLLVAVVLFIGDMVEARAERRPMKGSEVVPFVVLLSIAVPGVVPLPGWARWAGVPIGIAALVLWAWSRVRARR